MRGWAIRGARSARCRGLRRDFGPGSPDQIWAGDVTYIPTAQGWLRPAEVFDIGSRHIVGYSMADHARSQLVVDALDIPGLPNFTISNLLAHQHGVALTG